MKMLSSQCERLTTITLRFTFENKCEVSNRSSITRIDMIDELDKLMKIIRPLRTIVIKVDKQTEGTRAGDGPMKDELVEKMKSCGWIVMYTNDELECSLD